MLGAIIGDLAGSIYEYEQSKKVSLINVKEIISEKAFFSDDTILTIAIIDSILSNSSYEEKLREYGLKYINYMPNFKPYFKTIFSPGFEKWLRNLKSGNSIGNGAMMRISPIGYLFNTEEEVIYNAKLATIPSHNEPNAISAATKIALIIYYSRMKMSKSWIIDKLNLKIEYKPFEKFNMTCSDTIDNCIFALFTSSSFEESIIKIISYGGDTDTNACIVGSMAEAMYGIDSSLIKMAKEKIPPEFNEILEKAYPKLIL